MKRADKVKQVKEWWHGGKIKRIGDRSYAVPSSAFIFGITPRLVAQVVEKEVRIESR